MRQRIREYWASLWGLAGEKLKFDPQKRVCTFRIKVVLTTLTVCMILFGAAGFAILKKGANNEEPKIIDPELEKQFQQNRGPSTQKAPMHPKIFEVPITTTDSITEDPDPETTPNPRTQSQGPNVWAEDITTNPPEPEKTTFTSNGLLDALKNSKVTPCPPGTKLVMIEEGDDQNNHDQNWGDEIQPYGFDLKTRLDQLARGRFGSKLACKSM